MDDLDILILRLRGPLMAFGTVAVDEIRPTDVLPGLSFMTGLLGNALGWLYTDTEKLQALQDRLRMASRLDRPGVELCDYQNAHLHKADKLWSWSGQTQGREGGGSGEINVQRWRYYRADAAVTVALTLASPLFVEDGLTLDHLAQALKSPARPLFLGRVSCPPSRPVYHGERIRAASLHEALLRAPLMGGAAHSPWLVELPAEGQSDMLHVRERQDMRQWSNNVHSGSRMVRREHLQTADMEGGL